MVQYILYLLGVLFCHVLFCLLIVLWRPNHSANLFKHDPLHCDRFRFMWLVLLEICCVTEKGRGEMLCWAPPGSG